ncbi:hypothetical protein Tco_0073976 [Tanacetum coccineum]
MSSKDSIAIQTCELSEEEFNDFLALYHIPSEYGVMLPKSNQTIFDAPNRYSSIVPAEYPQLLLEHNKWDSKSYKDKLPPNIKENPMFQHLSRYPTSVRVFRDPILFLASDVLLCSVPDRVEFRASLKPSWEYGQQQPAIIVGGNEMAFRNFIYAENEEDLSFLPNERSLGFGIGSPSASVNTKPPNVDAEPTLKLAEDTADYGGSPKPEVFVVHPGSVAARIKDKRSSSSRATRANTSSSKVDPPFLTVYNDDEGFPNVFELKDANACQLKISAITPPAWKNYLDNHLDVELLDLHDRCYARQAIVDNVVNRRSQELLQSQKWAGYQDSLSALDSMVASLEAEKVRLEAIEVSLRKEVDDVKHDKMEVVLKVVPYAALELAIAMSWVGLLRATLSSAPASNPMSPPAVVSSVKPQSSQVVVRDFYKKFYNTLGRVPNRCSSSIGKTRGLLSLSRGIGWEGLIMV